MNSFPTLVTPPNLYSLPCQPKPVNLVLGKDKLYKNISKITQEKYKNITGKDKHKSEILDCRKTQEDLHRASTVLRPTAQIFNRTFFEVKYLNVASFILYLHTVKVTTESVTDFFFSLFYFPAFPLLNFKNITEMKMTCPFSDRDLTDPRNWTSTVEFRITKQF